MSKFGKNDEMSRKKCKLKAPSTGEIGCHFLKKLDKRIAEKLDKKSIMNK
jgi:hypothetical protein